jgi:hypothetical protein
MPLVRVCGLPTPSLTMQMAGGGVRAFRLARSGLPGAVFQRLASRHRGAKATLDPARGPSRAPRLGAGTTGAAACISGARPAGCMGRP